MDYKNNIIIEHKLINGNHVRVLNNKIYLSSERFWSLMTKVNTKEDYYNLILNEYNGNR